MKARRVKGLDPDGSLADNAQRIVAVRLDELCSFVPRALDPGEVDALHDMRIAAKRLRYVLEVTADTCFGSYATTAMKRTKELQDLLGELHDCDVQLPRVLALVDRLIDIDAREARERAATDAEDLDPVLAAGTGHAEAWRGLHTLAINLSARRELLFERFLELWRALEQEGLRERLERAIANRPKIASATAPSPDDNGTLTTAPLQSPASR